MGNHRMCAGCGLLVAVVATGLALGSAGTAAADPGHPIAHIVGDAAKTVQHVVGEARANVRQIADRSTATTPRLLGGLGGTAPFGGLVGNIVGGVGTATSHPINTRSLAQIQSQFQQSANLSVEIQQSGIDNGNAEAAQEELAQEQRTLIKAQTLADGIQNGTISNTQEVQVLGYIAQAKALQAQAHARFRNNIN